MWPQNGQAPAPNNYQTSAMPSPNAQNSAIQPNASGFESQPAPASIQSQFPAQSYLPTPTAPQPTTLRPASPLSYGDLIANNNARSNKNILSFLPNKALFILVGCILAGVIVIIIALATRRTAPGAIGDASATDGDLKGLYSLLRYGTNVSNGPTLDVMGESALVVASTQNILANKFSGIANAQDGTNAQIGADLKKKLDGAASVNDLDQAFYTELKSELANTAGALKKLAGDPGSATQQAAARDAAGYFAELYNRLNSDPVPDD